jgi:hypothetical protein
MLSCFRQNIQQTSSHVFTNVTNKDMSQVLIDDEEADKCLEAQVAINNWKKHFYEIYGPTFHKMSNSMLIFKQKYNEVVQILLALKARSKKQQKTKKERDYQRCYLLIGNVNTRCLFCNVTVGDPLLVPTFEEIFDVLYNIHSFLSHPMDFKKNKNELDRVSTAYLNNASRSS